MRRAVAQADKADLVILMMDSTVSNFESISEADLIEKELLDIYSEVR